MSTPPAPTNPPDGRNGASPKQASQASDGVPASLTRNITSDTTGTHEGARGHPTITPEPRPSQLMMNTVVSQTTPGTPGLLLPFDWEDFQDRYEKALADADEEEEAALKEFEQLSKYFNVWASSAATHDNERAVKRLQTRQRYVSLAEESMAQKQKHYDEVMRAFQSALALLSSK